MQNARTSQHYSSKLNNLTGRLKALAAVACLHLALRPWHLRSFEGMVLVALRPSAQSSKLKFTARIPLARFTTRFCCRIDGRVRRVSALVFRTSMPLLNITKNLCNAVFLRTRTTNRSKTAADPGSRFFPKITRCFMTMIIENSSLSVKSHSSAWYEYQDNTTHCMGAAALGVEGVITLTRRCYATK